MLLPWTYWQGRCTVPWWRLHPWMLPWFHRRAPSLRKVYLESPRVELTVYRAMLECLMYLQITYPDIAVDLVFIKSRLILGNKMWRRWRGACKGMLAYGFADLLTTNLPGPWMPSSTAPRLPGIPLPSEKQKNRHILFALLHFTQQQKTDKQKSSEKQINRSNH